MSNNKTYTPIEVKALFIKFIMDAQVRDLIHINEYDNGDGFTDKDGPWPGDDFEKWFEENIK